MKAADPVKRRPAETGGVSAAVALLVCRIAGVDDADTITAIGVLAGVVPAAITLLVSSGGLRGTVRLLWRGRDPERVAHIESRKGQR